MNKKVISLVVFISLFYLASFTLAQTTIPNPITGVDTFCQLITQIATAVGTLITYLGVIMIIVSGILYLTSAGSQERMGSAKKALIYAVIGIAVGLAAPAIISIIKTIIGAQAGTC